MKRMTPVGIQNGVASYVNKRLQSSLVHNQCLHFIDYLIRYFNPTESEQRRCRINRSRVLIVGKNRTNRHFRRTIPALEVHVTLKEFAFLLVVIISHCLWQILANSSILWAIVNLPFRLVVLLTANSGWSGDDSPSVYLRIPPFVRTVRTQFARRLTCGILDPHAFCRKSHVPSIVSINKYHRDRQ